MNRPYYVPRPAASATAPSTPRRPRTQGETNPESLVASMANINLGAANGTPRPKRYYIVTSGRYLGIFSTW